MTRPLIEDNTELSVSQLRQRVTRLERRPGPQSATGGPISATGVADSRSLTNSGSLDLQFRYIFNNDASFGYAVTSGGSPNRATYVTISTEGFYQADFVAYWNSNFTAGDNPYIQPRVYYPSSATSDALVNSDGVEAWDDTQDGIWGIQLAAAEMTYHSLRNVFFFNYDPSNGSSTWAGEDYIGLGVRINTSVSRTKNFGGQLHVTRLGGLVSQVTIT